MIRNPKLIKVEDNVEYAITKDAVGKTLAGDNMYSLHLPPNIPAKDYWSVLITKTDQDGSVDIWFGPVPPAGNRNNWIQTIPGKSWTTILRLYGTMEAWYNKTWRPGEIEVI